MLLSLVNGMWTEVNNATFRPGHEMPHSPPHFFITSQPAECKESNKNSKEASEYCGATNEVHSKVIWVTAYIRIPILWHTPFTLKDCFRLWKSNLYCIKQPELESVIVASFKCPDWYRELVQSSLYTREKISLMPKNMRKPEGMVKRQRQFTFRACHHQTSPSFPAARRSCHVPNTSYLCYNTSTCSVFSFWNSLPHLCLSNIYTLSSKSSVKVTSLIEHQ